MTDIKIAISRETFSSISIRTRLEIVAPRDLCLATKTKTEKKKKTEESGRMLTVFDVKTGNDCGE